MDNLGIRSYGVGITTLEEVFLKIGHGIEDDEKLIESKNSSEKLLKIQNETTIEDAKFDDYSITTDSEKNPFFTHLCALLKKKMLMQVRDKKTLSIDTIFPIFLILAGLALSTIAFFKDGVARLENPFLYPAPLNLYWNKNSYSLNELQTS